MYVPSFLFVSNYVETHITTVSDSGIQHKLLLRRVNLKIRNRKKVLYKNITTNLKHMRLIYLQQEDRFWGKLKREHDRIQRKYDSIHTVPRERVVQPAFNYVSNTPAMVDIEQF